MTQHLCMIGYGLMPGDTGRAWALPTRDASLLVRA